MTKTRSLTRWIEAPRARTVLILYRGGSLALQSRRRDRCEHPDYMPINSVCMISAKTRRQADKLARRYDHLIRGRRRRVAKP